MPNILATQDRKHLSTIDIEAVLTKVVPAQQKEIAKLRQEMKALKTK